MSIIGDRYFDAFTISVVATYLGGHREADILIKLPHITWHAAIDDH